MLRIFAISVGLICGFSIAYKLLFLAFIGGNPAAGWLMAAGFLMPAAGIYQQFKSEPIICGMLMVSALFGSIAGLRDI